MQPNYNNLNQPSWTKLSDDRRQLQTDNGDETKPIINWQELFTRLQKGIWRLWVSLRYRLNQKAKVSPIMTTNAGKKKWRVPWFKLGLAAFALFFLMQKDVQFTVRLNAPLSFITKSSEQTVVSDQMGLAQPVNFSNRKSKSDVGKKTANLDPTKAQAYIDRFARVARTEMQKYQIPASIKMAQALLESGAGTLSSVDNNHFGAPLAGNHFESAWANWRAHSLLLRRDYPDLFEHGINYKRWAKALKKTNYGQDRNYASKLLDIIDTYDLHRLDEAVM